MLGTGLLVGFAFANDKLNAPWFLAGLYTFFLFLASGVIGGQGGLIGLAVRFVLVGVLLRLLYENRDTVATWYGLLFGGIFLIGMLGRALS